MHYIALCLLLWPICALLCCHSPIRWFIYPWHCDCWVTGITLVIVLCLTLSLQVHCAFTLHIACTSCCRHHNVSNATVSCNRHTWCSVSLSLLLSIATCPNDKWDVRLHEARVSFRLLVAMLAFAAIALEFSVDCNSLTQSHARYIYYHVHIV